MIYGVQTNAENTLVIFENLMTRVIHWYFHRICEYPMWKFDQIQDS